MALIMTASIMFNSYKASAVALPVSVLTYLIEACCDILFGSGLYTQDQLNNMSTTDIFDATKTNLPNIDISSLPKDPRTNLELFLMQNLPKYVAPVVAPVYSAGEFAFRNFILDEQFNLPTVNPDLKGFGACSKTVLNSTGKIQTIGFGSYGLIYNLDVNGKRTCELQAGDSIVKYTIFYDGYQKDYTYDTRKVVAQYGDELRTVTLIGDWRYLDGTPATDLITFSEEVPAPIGTVDVDGETYDVNGDGTVTIEDTTVNDDGSVSEDDKTYTINEDGSITIDNRKYYPHYDLTHYPDKSITNLIINILDTVDVAEESDEETEEDIEDEEVELPEELVRTELSSLTMPNTIATVFPFCIPWDFVHGIEMLSADPVAPRFEVPFEIPAYKSFPGFKKMIVIDFSEYSTHFAIVRWTFFTLFMFGLCFITFKIVKGA